MRTTIMPITMACAVLALVPFTSPAGAAVPAPPTMETAGQLMEEQAWGDAAKAYAEIVEADPENGQAWFLMGYSLHADGQLEKALEVHRRASKFDEFQGIALYNVGCAHALLGHHDQALAALANAAEAGFDVAGHAGDDQDLRSLHDHPHFHALMAHSSHLHGGDMRSDGGGAGRAGNIMDRIKMGLGQVQQIIAAKAPEVMAQVQMIVEQAMQMIQQKIAELQGQRPPSRGTFEMEAEPEIFAAPATPTPPAFEAPVDTPFGIPTEEQIGRLLENEDFKGAASALKRVVKADPDNGQAWFLLGYSLHAAGKLDEAIKVHKKAATFEDRKGIALYNLGCAYALQGKTDQAFEALNKSRRAGGFNMLGTIEGDSDLDSLRDDDRYRTLLEVLRFPDF